MIWPKARWENSENNCDRSVLAQPMNFPVAKEVTTKNRFMLSAMSEHLSSFDSEHPEKSGIPTPETMELYRKYAKGQFGMVVTGCVVIDPDEIEAPGNNMIHESIDSAERREGFRQWARTIKENGAAAIAQVFHPGARSPIKPGHENFNPATVSKERLEQIFDQYVYASLYAEDCGFDGVEVGCAYAFTIGYLMAKEMNKRTDEYGGSFENRTRGIFKIVDGIRKKARNNSKFVVGLKLNAYNLAVGFNEEEFTAFLKKAEEHGVDYFTITGGSWNLLGDLSDEKLSALNPIERAYRLIAKTMKNEVKKAKVYMNGNFVTVHDMCDAVQTHWAHGISLGRPAASEPDLPLKILNGDVDGAVKSLVDLADMFTALQVAGVQFWQHATNHAVLDPSNPEHMEKFKESVANHQKARSEATPNNPVIGFPKLIL